MKKISVLVPTYNEEENIIPLSEAIIKEFELNLPQYDYEIIVIDNSSKDNTQEKILTLCKQNNKIKAIFNCKNFGQNNSPYYGMLQTRGDCTISMCADFQDPVEMLPKFVQEWEKGYKIVCGIKTTSKENRFIRLLRSVYYKMIKKFSDVEQIEHFTGFGLYDKSFIEILRHLNDPSPFLRGVVAEIGPERKEIPYEQQRRRAGKSSNNWYSLYDLAMLSFTSYTKIGLRIITIAGFVFSMIGFVMAFVYLIMKLLNWQNFSAGMAPILIGVFLFGSVQLFITGFLGEYVMSINKRVMNRPLVIEKKRINFDDN
jgi:polyisoprenyl-phosphate glycosyltransferase